MKLTIESTSQTLMVGDQPARVWLGLTPGGLPVVCIVARVLPQEPKQERVTIEMQPAGQDAYAPA